MLQNILFASIRGRVWEQSLIEKCFRVITGWWRVDENVRPFVTIHSYGHHTIYTWFGYTPAKNRTL